MRPRSTNLLLLAAVLLTAGPAPTVQRAVSIRDMQFSPETLKITTGDTVVWTNGDDRDHTVVSQNGAFKSENLRPGKSFSFQFAKAGTFAYVCSYHPRMKGTVVVSEK